MNNFSFRTTIRGPLKSRDITCEGSWQITDGDEIRPGTKYFHPETVWLHRGSRKRQLANIPNWLWETLSWASEDAWRDAKYENDPERERLWDEYEDYYDSSDDRAEPVERS